MLAILNRKYLEIFDFMFFYKSFRPPRRHFDFFKFLKISPVESAPIYIRFVQKLHSN
jgi:hypothetical protein